MQELKLRILEKIANRRQDIIDIESACNEHGEYSYEDSMNIEYYEGMIVAYNDVLQLLPFRLCIAGSRSFKDRALMEDEVVKFLLELNQFGKPIEVVSGTAQGADSLGELYASDFGHSIQRFPADWSQGKKAGPLRNEEMARYSDAVIVFWNGTSSGTKSMISLAKKYEKPLKIINYDEDRATGS